MSAPRGEGGAREAPGDGRALALVGLRGAGKSTVGRALAERLARPFVDLDDALAGAHGERGEGAGAVLRRVGEPRFRELERATLLEALARADAPVVATGGGVVERADNRADLAARCRCVWLRARPDVLVARLAADPTERPALTQLDPAAEVRALLARRAPLYAEVAARTVDVDELALETLLERIISELAR